MTITEMMEMMMTNEKQLNKTNYNVNHSEFQKADRQTHIVPLHHRKANFTTEFFTK